MKKRNYYVYIVANKNNTVLYTGVTNDLRRRIHEHKTKLNKGFTAKYNVYKLVYFEQYTDIGVTILREKRIKKWKREWKERLIQEKNPGWIDLACDLYQHIDQVKNNIAIGYRIGKDGFLLSQE